MYVCVCVCGNNIYKIYSKTPRKLNMTITRILNKKLDIKLGPFTQNNLTEY